MGPEEARHPTRWARVRAARATRVGLLVVLTVVGLVIGLGIGGATVPADTTTVFRTETTETTTTVVTTRIVRKPPVTVVRTIRQEVLKGGGDNEIDYGDFEGQFHIRGVQGYNDTDIGGAKIVGQIQSPTGCAGYVQIDATFYNGGKIVDTEFTNFESLPAGSWVPFTIGLLEGSMDTYDLLLSKADC